MPRILKRISISALMIVISIVLGTVAMIVIYAVPTNRAQYHILESEILFGRDISGKEYWAFPEISSNLDSFTDSIMLNNAIYRPYDSVIKNAMLNPRVEYESTEMTMNVLRFIKQGGGGRTVDYSRYWHGYLTLLIPALSFFSLGEIRIIMMIIQLFLLSAIVIELTRKAGNMAAGLFLLAVMLINPISAALCLQYATIYHLVLISMLVVLKKSEWLNRGDVLLYFFVLLGISCAFFDFLTYSVITLCMPLAALLMIRQRERVTRRKISFGSRVASGEESALPGSTEGSFREPIIMILRSCLGWSAGYAGMWAGKWVVASVLTGQNVIQNGITAVQLRAQGDGIAEGVSDTSFLTTIQKNLRIFHQPLVMGIISIILLLFLILAAKKMFRKPTSDDVIPFVLIAVIPFLWTLVIRQHSAVHSFMVYKIFAATIWALCCIPICLKKRINDGIPGEMGETWRIL